MNSTFGSNSTLADCDPSSGIRQFKHENKTLKLKNAELASSVSELYRKQSILCNELERLSENIKQLSGSIEQYKECSDMSSYEVILQMMLEGLAEQNVHIFVLMGSIAEGPEEMKEMVTTYHAEKSSEKLKLDVQLQNQMKVIQEKDLIIEDLSKQALKAKELSMVNKELIHDNQLMKENLVLAEMALENSAKELHALKKEKKNMIDDNNLRMEQRKSLSAKMSNGSCPGVKDQKIADLTKQLEILSFEVKQQEEEHRKQTVNKSSIELNGGLDGGECVSPRVAFKSINENEIIKQKKVSVKKYNLSDIVFKRVKE